jgi:hypothetical protein
MLRPHHGVLLLALGAAATARAQDTAATAILGDSGIVVRFPRTMSPDSITRDMLVGDLFSGYEWRIILVGENQVLLTAFVIPPDDTLAVHRYATIKAAYLAGDLRSCQRDNQVLACDQLARGLVRDVGGCIEVAIVDTRWLGLALRSPAPKLRLVVKRNREELWSREVRLETRDR